MCAWRAHLRWKSVRAPLLLGPRGGSLVGGGFGLDLAAGGWVLQGLGGWLDKLDCDYKYIYICIYIFIFLFCCKGHQRAIAANTRCLQTVVRLDTTPIVFSSSSIAAIVQLSIVFGESITFAVSVSVAVSFFRVQACTARLGHWGCSYSTDHSCSQQGFHAQSTARWRIASVSVGFTAPRTYLRTHGSLQPSTEWPHR